MRGPLITYVIAITHFCGGRQQGDKRIKQCRRQMLLWNMVFCLKNYWVSYLLKNARFRWICNLLPHFFLERHRPGEGGGQTGPYYTANTNYTQRDWYEPPITMRQISLTVLSGGLLISWQCLKLRLSVNRIPYHWSRMRHGLTFTYLPVTGNVFLAALRTGTSVWCGMYNCWIICRLSSFVKCDS